MATSKLQKEVGDLLDFEFPEYRILENYRPDWLISSECTRLELDFYIEEQKIAFEIQGEQHFSFIPFFHGDKKGFERRKKMDAEKRELCNGYGIMLYEICTKTDAMIAISEIKQKYCKQPKYSYSYPDIYRYKKQEKNPAGNRKERKIAWNMTDEAAEKRLRTLIEKIKKYESGEIFAEPKRVEKWKLTIKNNGYIVGDD